MLVAMSDPSPSFATVFRPFDADATQDASAADLEPQSFPRPVDVSASSAGSSLRYEVRSILGRGGMGEVRLCHDARIGRDVAIKVAHGGGAASSVGSPIAASAPSTSARRRFLREARVQGQLEHPAIVPVYDLEILPDGSAYFAMKRVRGRTLGAVLDEQRAHERRRAPVDADGSADLKPMPLRKLLATFASVCLAVEFAHSRGVVHRDIKPGNIMIGDFGEVYLLDWGLAKLLTHDDDALLLNGPAALPWSPSSSPLSPSPSSSPSPGAELSALRQPQTNTAETQAGTVLGTPGYMAPEQIDPALGGVGIAADIYALGAVLFEIVSLERYIQARDTVDATLQTLHGRERLPSQRAPGRAIPPALDEICVQALARLPAERFATARALHDAVDRFLAGEHDQARLRALSLAHFDDARGRVDSVDGRALALRDLGGALALDPTNLDARRELLRLLTTPPQQLPPAVQERRDDDERGQVRRLAMTNLVAGASFLPLWPVAIFVIGVKDAVLWWAIGAALCATIAGHWLIARSARPRGWHHVVAHGCYFLTIAGCARIAGPLVLVPALFCSYVIEQQMHPHGAQRGYAIAACFAAMLATVAVEVSGLVAPSYTFTDDGSLLIHSRLLQLSPLTFWLIGLATFGTIGAGCASAWRSRTYLLTAEAELRLQHWQLAQIVPADDNHDTSALGPAPAG